MSDTTLSWVHLSDFHADPARLPLDDDKLLRALPDYLTSLRESRRRGFDFMLFTGDLVRGVAVDDLDNATSLKQREVILNAKQAELDAQYEYAIGQIQRVHEAVDVPKSMCFFVPGNHDAAWTDLAPPLETLVTECKSRIAAERHRFATLESMQPLLHSRWLHWLRREGYLLPGENDVVFPRGRARTTSRAGGHYAVKIGLDGANRDFDLFVLNSCWMCAHTMRGEYQLPAGAHLQVRDLLAQIERQHQKIVPSLERKAARPTAATTPARMIAIHHPPEWLLHDDALRLLSAFRSEFHLLAHGHLHKAMVDSMTSGHVRIGCGAMYQGSEREHAFLACDLDLTTGLLHTEIHEYSRFATDWRSQAGGWRLREGDDGLPESGRNRAVLRFNRTSPVARGGIEHFERHTAHRGVVLAIDICGFSSLGPDTQAAAIQLLWSTANRTIAEGHLNEAAVVSSMGDGIQIALDENSVPRLPTQSLRLLAVLFDAFSKAIENAQPSSDVRPVKLRAGAAFGTFVVLREVAPTRRVSRHILAGNACNQARRIAFLGRANFIHICSSLSKRVAAEESGADSPSFELLGLRVIDVKIYSPEFGASETAAFFYRRDDANSTPPRPYSDEHRRLAQIFRERLSTRLRDVLTSLGGKNWKQHLCAELLYLARRPEPGSTISEFGCALTSFGETTLDHKHWSKLEKGHADVIDSAMAGRSAVFDCTTANVRVLIADKTTNVREIPGYEPNEHTWSQVQPIAAMHIGPNHPKLVLTMAMRLNAFAEHARPTRALDAITRISLSDHLHELETFAFSVV